MFLVLCNVHDRTMSLFKYISTESTFASQQQDHRHKSFISRRMKCKVNIARGLLTKNSMKKKKIPIIGMVAILFFKGSQKYLKASTMGWLFNGNLQKQISERDTFVSNQSTVTTVTHRLSPILLKLSWKFEKSVCNSICYSTHTQMHVPKTLYWSNLL